MNEDRVEIGKFDAIAHRFWDPAGDFRPLHLINPVRSAYVAGRCQITAARVLDIACGGGLMKPSGRFIVFDRGALTLAVHEAKVHHRLDVAGVGGLFKRAQGGTVILRVVHGDSAMKNRRLAGRWVHARGLRSSLRLRECGERNRC